MHPILFKGWIQVFVFLVTSIYSPLNKVSILLVTLSELGGRHALDRLEGAVEVGYGVEATLVAYLHHRLRAVGQQEGCLPYAHVVYVVGDGTVRFLLEEATQGVGGHVHHVAQRLHAYLVLVVGVYVVLELLDATACHGYLGV